MEHHGGILVWLLFALIYAVDSGNGVPNVHLHVTDIGTDTFTLSWDEVPNMGFTSYEVVLTGGGGNQKVVPVAVKTGTKPSKVITDLEPGQAYNITIHGLQNGNKVRLENLLKIVLNDERGHELVIPLGEEAGAERLVQYTLPMQPRQISHRREGGGIKVAWSHPEGKFSYFVITYTLDGVKKRKVVNGVESSYTFTDPKDGHKLEVLSIASGVGTSPDRLIESTPFLLRNKPGIDSKPVGASKGDESGKDKGKEADKPVGAPKGVDSGASKSKGAEKTVSQIDEKSAASYKPDKSSEINHDKQEGSADTSSSMPGWRKIMIASVVTGTVVLVGLLLAAFANSARKRYQ